MTKYLKLLLVTCLLMFSFGSFAQTGTISGTILADDDASPLVGVTVTNTVTNKKTTTNQAGYFSLAADPGQRLLITYVGYARKEYTVGADKMISIKMVASDKDLDNVVVTGYGQKKNKRELAYQTPTVKGEEIAATRRDNFLNSLAGRVPGLTVTSTSGLPGASAQIILRGATSISGSNQPLFVVDGVPQDNSGLNQENLIAASNANGVGFANRSSDYTNRIADINPEDIESVVILKGPEATALYGSDGASGAIVVTTKKGASGRTRISYDNTFRVNEMFRFPEIQTQYTRGANGLYNPEAYSSVYGYKFFGPAYEPGVKLYNNLQDFFQTSTSQQHNVSLENGTADASYRFSAGYLKSNGVIANTDYTRMTFRFTGQTKLGKKMSMTSSWTYTISDNNKVSKGAGSYYNNLITFPREIDAKDYINADGTRKYLRTTQAGTDSEFDNPYWDINKNPSNDKTDRLTGTMNLTADVAKWLNLTTIVGLDNFSTQGYTQTNKQSRYGYNTGGFFGAYTTNYRNINAVARATFKKTFNKIFTNSLSTSFYIEDGVRAVNAQKGEQLFETEFISINNTAPLTQAAKLTQTNIRKIRMFANYTAGYRDILYVTLAGVREGVSTLASKNYNTQPFFNYGSASMSFIFSDLSMFKKADWFSYGKLRASYATSGKAPYAAYVIDPQFATQVSTGGGYALGVIASNRNLRPEKTKNFEVGTELQFFKKRVTLDMAYYNLRTLDQIVSNRLSYGTGGVLKFINGGEVENKGIEIQLKATPIQAKNFIWDATVNFDKNRSKVIRMPADLPLYYDSDTWVFGAVRTEVAVGTSMTNLVGLAFQRNNAGQLLISTTTGLPLPTGTYTNIADRTPDFKIGLINSFTLYKNFNLSFNLDIRRGGDVFNGTEAMMMLTGTSKRTLDREQPRIVEGVLADGLQNTATPTKNQIVILPYQRSDYYDVAFAEGDFVENVNWLRMRDITLSYTLSSKILKRQKVVKSASVYVTGTDLFMITNYSGVDPNVNALNSSTGGVGGMGIDYGAISTPRGVNFGVRLQF